MHGTELEGNDLGIESFDHGSVEVGSNVTLTNNTAAADAGRNSFILFSDAATCIFTGNGSMTVSGYSTIEGYGGGCGTNATCDPGANGSCIP